MIDDFERQLTAGLHALVDDQHPPAELRERIATELDQGSRRRRMWIPSAAAALVVFALVAAVFAFRDDGSGTVDVATNPDPAVTVPDVTTTVPGTTVVEPATTMPVPTTEATGPVEAPTTTAASGPIAPATTAPATTVPACRNSTDPACGFFHWDPAPTNRAATLTITVPDGPIVAGQEVPVTLTMSDPDGAVTLDCFSVALSGSGMSGGSCSATNPVDCPPRYGPWTPPAPQPSQAATDTIVTFDQPGTYVVSAEVTAADGCDNVDPYRSGATASITVQVAEPSTTTTAGA